MRSALYHGSVRHRRAGPVPHAFRYRLFMVYLDLAELPGLFDRFWLWSARRPAPAWWRRADYLGPATMPLDDAVRETVHARIGRRPAGPVRMLTHLRYWGHIMNPVTFYYCFDSADRQLDAVVAEITNTPWGERHAYVLAREPGVERGTPPRTPLTGAFSKRFHVSPFMNMDHTYRWRFSIPDRRVVVHMENARHGHPVFDATLALRRRPLTGPALAATLFRHPWMTAAVTAGIYWQALRLWLKGTPFYVHPAKRGVAP